MEYGINVYIYIWGSLGNIFSHSLLCASKMKVGSFIETFFGNWIFLPVGSTLWRGKRFSTWHDARDLPT